MQALEILRGSGAIREIWLSLRVSVSGTCEQANEAARKAKLID